MNMNELQHELDRVKIALMSNSEVVFFTTIALNLKFFWDEECRTAWTDGFKIGFNPSFFMSMSPEERLGVYIHEACHVAYDHMGRLLGRDMRIWNIAADHVINLYLLARGFKLPSFRLADKCFENMSTEQVYDVLKMGDQDLPDNEMEDIRIDPTKKPEEYKRQIEDIIIKASIAAKMSDTPGVMPGEIEVFIKNLMQPKLPWQTILRREMYELIKTGHSWMHPNRRYFPKHHLPSSRQLSIQEATFYVDISCSVSDHQFKIFVSEIAGAIRMFGLRRVTIVQFDTEIKSIDVVKNMKDLKDVEFTGRGGTAIECILVHMEKTKPQLAMVFTDGGFYWPRDTFRQRILWLINDNPHWKPKYGRAIHFSTRKR